ncbi:hypothetical protein ACFST9_22905 [Hymenobacter monticola]|uniref:DUF4251 domain-containing protein n=1 Tax=Hymenobacter monticola TaxID=1705399 RepID=A0ABY4B4W7_9BACT|nr:hypothetical protein [Hymenobacter monticola]UOE34050.1 hypothetical protein MTP16_00005 [Hymenobacter monticola]
MFKSTLFLASALLVCGVARAQAPATEVKALTARLNQLMADPKADDDTEVRVSLADCGFRQTVRKYRKPDKASTTNIAISNSKNGSSWGFKSNENVELELTLAQEWAEVGSVTYAAKEHDKGGSRYYELTVKRRAEAKGKSSSGLASTITLSLNTDNEKEVAALVKRLDAVRQQCTSRRG